MIRAMPRNVGPPSYKLVYTPIFHYDYLPTINPRVNLIEIVVINQLNAILGAPRNNINMFISKRGGVSFRNACNAADLAGGPQGFGCRGRSRLVCLCNEGDFFSRKRKNNKVCIDGGFNINFESVGVIEQN